jgi:hypothetical protein
MHPSVSADTPNTHSAGERALCMLLLPDKNMSHVAVPAVLPHCHHICVINL